MEKWNFRSLSPNNHAARKHCIPGELLAAIIANEQIDYSSMENFGEWLGFGQSIGLAQITIDTAIRYGLTDCDRSDFKDKFVSVHGAISYISAEEQYRSCVRSKLENDSDNIEGAARLMSQYLDILCKKSKEGSMSSSFQSLAYGCNVNDFCCRNSGDNCAIQDVPSCLMGALAAAWNNGIAIADLDHIVRNSKKWKGIGRIRACPNVKINGFVNPKEGWAMYDRIYGGSE